MTQRLSTTQDGSGHSVRPVGCRILIVILTAFLLTTASVPESATAVDKLALRRKQIDQQRARAMAQKLVSSAVDLQIHQLEDNGLTELPIYKEITSMRGSIGELVETEMADVVEILLDAQHLDSAADREAKFVAARSTIREIVIRLAVERHNLLRRLRNAEIAEQIKRLIRLETETMTVTKGLPEESQTRREQLAVRAIEDQRDIKELFLHLVETLADVSSWDGAIGQGATKGLIILKREEVGLHLDRSGAELVAARFASSAVEQAQVVAGLKKLLDEVLHTQGLISSDSESIFARIEELASRQSEIRAKVQNADLSNTDESTALTTEQDAIKAELEELAEVVADNPQAAKHVEEAIEAAAQASEQIFSEASEQAINSQRLVEGHLAALQDKLQQEIQTQLGDKTAAELAETVKSLEATKAELEQAMQSQQQADQNSATAPKKVAQQEEAVKVALTEAAKAADSRQLPEELTATITAAEDAVAKAVEAAKQAAKTDNPDSERDQAAAEEATKNASDAVERALASTQESLAEAQRMEAAVKIGELARAAEALERAAAAERKIAETAKDVAAGAPVDPESAKELTEEQATVQDVAERIAEGVKETAPKVSEALKQTAAKAQSAKTPLEKVASAAQDAATAKAATEAAKADNNEEAMAQAKKAGNEARNAAAESAKQAAQSAGEAASELASAARELRNEIAETAKQLAQLSEKQLAQVKDAQAAVDDTIRQTEKSVADRLQKLAQARNEVAKAFTEQQRAEGRPEAANAMELAQKIAEALAMQNSADNAADDVESGAAATPLEAATRQLGVSDLAQQIGKEATERPQAKAAQEENKPDALANALRQAQQAGAEAARKALDGDSKAAEAARDQTREALTEALNAAVAEADQLAMEEPTGKPDARAQQDVATKAKAAGDLAQEDAANAAAALTDAAAAADQAVKEIGEGLPEMTKTSQKKATDALTEAAKTIDEAARNLAGEQATELAAVSEKANTAAGKSAQVDASAAAAIREAQQAANKAAEAAQAANEAKPEASGEETSAKDSPRTPRPELDAVAADQEIAENLERAAADLAAKAQQLGREQALALALAELSKSQQESVEQLADARNSLKDADKPKRTDPNSEDAPGTAPAADQASEEMTPAQGSAAKKLAQAMKQFSDSQRLTGEGAVELSGQEEVANLPIREALDLASELLKSSKPPLPVPPNSQPQELAALDSANQPPQTSPIPPVSSEGSKPAPAESATADGNAADGDASTPEAPSAPTDQSGNPQPGDQANGQPQPGQPGSQNPGQQPPGSAQQGQPQSAQLGTGFVPDSPEATARLMADPELLAQLAELMEAAMAEAAQNQDAAAAAQTAATEAGQPAAAEPPSGQPPSTVQPPQNAQASQKSEGGGASDVGLPTENQATKDDPLNLVDTATPSKDGRTPTSSDRTRQIDTRQFRQAAWFAKLPAELRNAILAGSQRRAPRAYEDRLRRYFESLE
tara:strand:+ start:15711 stop:20147 length:4437 start_codon:yes stop_codon:yes gene_type:complete